MPASDTQTLVAPARAGASVGAIRHHYDLGNEFYALWLDPSMTYSCALWEPGDDLEAAQRRKLDYLCAETVVSGRGRILDVGCGWGSAMEALRTRHSVTDVVGLTLSAAQRDHIAASARPHTEVRLEHWADHQPRAPYDGILSIGAFEHFARLGLTPAEKVAAYREFFTFAHDNLPPGGRLVVQTIARGFAPATLRAFREGMFIATEIFPESDLPRVADLFLASDKLFEAVRLRTGRHHYARTCAAWLDNLRANRDRIEAVAGADAFATYERYLDICVRQFEDSHSTLLRATFERVG